MNLITNPDKSQWAELLKRPVMNTENLFDTVRAIIDRVKTEGDRAVLEKRVGFKLAQKDVFLNIAGGLKVNDPAIDLAVISAILSSNMDTAIEPEVCMAGEIGLSGEIRPVNRIEQRIGEAEKLGFKRFILPKYNMQGLNTQKIKIELIPVRKVEEAFRALFG